MSKLPKSDLDCYWSATGRTESTRVNPFTWPLNPAPDMSQNQNGISSPFSSLNFFYWIDTQTLPAATGARTIPGLPPRKRNRNGRRKMGNNIDHACLLARDLGTHWPASAQSEWTVRWINPGQAAAYNKSDQSRDKIFFVLSFGGGHGEKNVQTYRKLQMLRLHSLLYTVGHPLSRMFC